MIRAPGTPKSEFSVKFLQGMVDRMGVSFYKYGAVKDAVPFKIDALKSAQARVREYERTKNTEFLIDAANFLMMEFMRPSKDGARYIPTDSDKSPGRTSASGSKSTLDNASL